MKFEITSRLSGFVLFSLETESLKLAVEAAVKSAADLREATLYGADLHGADLHGADLRGANLYGADLDGANLYGADLYAADLREATLRGANLGRATLHGADLHGADLGGATLEVADLTPIRDDTWAVLSSAPAEVEGLRQAILDGRIDGSAYEGACACLVGTLANVRHCKYNEIAGLEPNSSRPAERFFAGIKPGDTPENSQFSKLALEWVDQWLTNMKAAFAAKEAS